MDRKRRTVFNEDIMYYEKDSATGGRKVLKMLEILELYISPKSPAFFGVRLVAHVSNRLKPNTWTEKRKGDVLFFV